MSSKAGNGINTNMSVISVGKAIEYLGEALTTIINANLPVALLPSVMLWGPPGVGKSQGVRQLAVVIE
jgi:MoxR-like ATPase